MRRGLASLIMGLSLLVATASWAGFVMSRTVLDPGRSERLADTLLDDPEIRETIIDRLADSAESQIPADVPVARDVLEEGAANALDDPRVEALIRDGLVRVHQNALNGVDEPVTLDGAALGAAGRDAVVAQQPDLDPFLPPAPNLEVELPSTGLSWLGTVKQYVDRFTLIGAIVAIVGIFTAFGLARNRAAALRRVAFWAIGASAFWVAAAFGLPWLLERIAPSSVSIAMAAIDVFFGAMIRPAVTLAGIGVGLLLLSFVWPAIERRRPAAQLDRQRAAPPQPHAVPARVDPSAGWSPVASPAARPVPSQPVAYEERAGYLEQWTPGLGRPSRAPRAPEQPLDATRPFPQVWSNVGRDPGGVVPGSANGATGAPAAPPTQVAAAPSPAPAAPPTQAAPVTSPTPQAPTPQAPTPQAPVPQAPTPQAPVPQAPVPQPPRPWPSSPQAPTPQPPREPAPAPATEIVQRAADPDRGGDWLQPPPAVDIDADAAAEADDFGAEWVEGRGYVDGGSAR